MWKTSPYFLWWFYYRGNCTAACPILVVLDNLNAQQWFCVRRRRRRRRNCLFVCWEWGGGLTCWRLTQEHVLPLDDQNMSISLRCFTTNPLWGMSETYLYLGLRWRALNRQFISHFRHCFLADKWHLLPKPSGWSPLPATIALLGWAPNIHHNTVSACRSVWLCSHSDFWQKTSEVSGCISLSLSICCLVPKLVTGTPWRMPPPPPAASSSALMQCSNKTALSDRLQTRPCVDLLSSVGSRWVTTPEISGGNYKYEAVPPFTFWQTP